MYLRLAFRVLGAKCLPDTLVEKMNQQLRLRRARPLHCSNSSDEWASVCCPQQESGRRAEWVNHVLAATGGDGSLARLHSCSTSRLSVYVSVGSVTYQDRVCGFGNCVAFAWKSWPRVRIPYCGLIDHNASRKCCIALERPEVGVDLRVVGGETERCCWYG